MQVLDSMKNMHNPVSSTHSSFQSGVCAKNGTVVQLRLNCSRVWFWSGSINKVARNVADIPTFVSLQSLVLPIGAQMSLLKLSRSCTNLGYESLAVESITWSRTEQPPTPFEAAPVMGLNKGVFNPQHANVP